MVNINFDDVTQLETASGVSSGSIVLRVIVVSIILILVFLIIFSILIVTKPELFRKNKKSADGDNNVKYDAEINPKIGDSKAFLPYKSLKDYSIDLGNYNYRAILEISSINYHLMSQTEQEMTDSAYRAFLDSLDFPIEIYIQTREFDFQKVIDDLEERTVASIKKYPQLEDYCKLYINEMTGITKRFGNSKIKKKYVIVPFNQEDFQDVSELSPTEIDSFATEELLSRCNIVASGLEAVGLKVDLLDKSMIAECLYSYYHRDTFRIAEDIVNGSLNSLVINGPEHRADDRQVLDTILSSAQRSIQTKLVKASTSDEELVLYKFIFNELEKFKQDDIPQDMSHLFYSTLEAAEAEGYEDDYYDYAKKHPEAKFWELSPHDFNNYKVSPPDGWNSAEHTSQKDDQKYLGGTKKQFDESKIGEFDPSQLANQSQRRR